MFLTFQAAWHISSMKNENKIFCCLRLNAVRISSSSFTRLLTILYFQLSWRREMQIRILMKYEYRWNTERGTRKPHSILSFLMEYVVCCTLYRGFFELRVVVSILKIICIITMNTYNVSSYFFQPNTREISCPRTRVRGHPQVQE